MSIMGKHSNLAEAYHISTTRSCLEAFKANLSNRGFMGRMAMKAAGTAAAFTAAGVAMFGITEFDKAANPEPVLVSSEQTTGNEISEHPLSSSIEQSQEDFWHMMGAVGAFSVLTLVGVGLVARRVSASPEETASAYDYYGGMPDPDLVEDITPDSSFVLQPAYNEKQPFAVHQSLADELFGSRY